MIISTELLPNGKLKVIKNQTSEITKESLLYDKQLSEEAIIQHQTLLNEINNLLLQFDDEES